MNDRPTADGTDSDTSQQPTPEGMSLDDDQPPRLSFPVVGIGASAGGIEAVLQLVEHLRPDSGLAFVLVQHLPPDRESLLPEILAQRTTMPVLEIEDGMPIEKDHLYVIRPGRTLTIRDGALRLGEPLDRPMRSRPIDDFYKSLAEEMQERAIAIVMSGMGSNGSAGAQAIKAVGGLCIAQEPETAKFPSMPRHLMDTGAADYVLTPKEMPDVLLAYAGHPYTREGRHAAGLLALQRDQLHLREVLSILRTRTRRDFSGYKKPTVLRRIQRRMGLNQVTNLGDYARLLRQSATEVTTLADDLLIHVTGFFRDEQAWDALRELVIVPLVGSREPDASIRAWVTACSTGEEAYTLAMLLVEECERVGKYLDIKVFATDMADRSLQNARQGVYPGGIEAEVTPERLERFFIADDGVYRVRQELRERVVFAPQNVLRDPPFSRLDIATCRNLLIYLEPEVQQRVLTSLHFGLREGGTLFLGNSETTAGDDLFEPIDKKARIYRRVGPTQHGSFDLQVSRADFARRAERLIADGSGPAVRPSLAQLTTRALLEHHTPAAVTIDRDLRIVYYHGKTETFLAQPRGEPTRDLMANTRETLRWAVRTSVHRAMGNGGSSSTVEGLLEPEPGRRVRVGVTTSPLDEKAAPDYFVVSFLERGEVASVERTATPNDPPDGELDRVRDELQTAVEELQTSNEELKASHEEVMSVNEELQSTNEELETSREEMQSLNEELATINGQLLAKMEEHRAANNDLTSLLTSTDLAVLFLDTRFRIRRFTPQIRELLDVIASDVDRPLDDLARKFHDPQLLTDAAMVLERLVPAEREVESHHGPWYLRRITPYRTTDNRIDGVVITFVDITGRRIAEQSLRQSEEQFRRAILEAPVPVIMHSETGVVLQVSRTWTEVTGYTMQEMPTLGRWLGQVVVEGGEALRSQMEELFVGTRDTLRADLTLRARSGSTLEWTLTASSPGALADGSRFVVGMALDVTEHRQSERTLRDVNAELQRQSRVFESTLSAITDLVYLVDGSGRMLDANKALLDLWQLRRDDVIGKTVAELPYPPDLSRRFSAELQQVVTSGRPLHGEAVYTAPNGVDGVYEYIDTPVFGPDGAVVAVAGSARDITERKRAQDGLRVNEERLSGELAAIQQLNTVSARLARVSGLDETLREVLDGAIELSGASMGSIQLVGADGSLSLVAHRDLPPDWLASLPAISASEGSSEAGAGQSGERVVIEDVEAEAGYAPFREAAAAAGVRGTESTPLKRRTGELFGVLTTLYPSAHRPPERTLRIADLYTRLAADSIERAQEESALRVSEERFRAILGQSAAGVAQVDLSGNVWMVNDRMCEIVGCSREELLERRILDFSHAADVEENQRLFAGLARDGTSFDLERRFVRPDGSVVWARVAVSVIRDSTGHPTSATVIAIDVSDRRSSEEQLRLIIEGGRDFAIVMLDRSGRITSWNVGAQQIFGYHEAEVVGKGADLTFTPEDRAVGAPQEELDIAERDGRAEEERWYLRKDGTQFWGSGILTVSRSDEGRLLGFLKILRDETTRKQAEQAVLASKNAAEAANRTKDEFLATLGHELRTPLSTILVWAKVLRSTSHAMSPDQQAEGLDAITRGAQAQKQLLEDLLDTSRISTGTLRLELERTDLASLVRAGVASVLPSAQGRGIALETELGTDIGVVWADPHRIQQVVWNLLSNAIKFTPAGGRVHVTLTRLGREVELRVRDTGRGIEPEFLPFVFEPFRQADGSTTRAHGGLGLGLAICKQIVKQHGGSITARSPGAEFGTTVTVRMPLGALWPTPEQVSSSPASVTDDLSLRDMRILLVEDEPETRAALTEVLRRAGAAVTAVDHAGAALVAFERARPDLLISDIGMKDEDGYSLIRKIRALETERSTPPVPATALTAFAGTHDRDSAFEAGFDHHIAKPADPDELLRTLAALARGVRDGVQGER